MPAIRALLIGINGYAPGSSVKDLHGCVPDVMAVRELLVRRLGVEEAAVRTLVDSQATIAAVREAWQTHLCDALQPGDVAYVHYSGHGSTARTDDPDAPSGFEESLVLWDSRQPEGSDLRDADLARLMALVQARGAQLILFLDCCHAGGATRSAGETRAVPVAVRWCPPDRRAPAAPLIPDAPASMDGPQPLVLAACLDEEKAAEYVTPAGWHGAATWFFLQAVDQVGDALTWAQIHARVSAGVRTQFPRQTPELKGSGDLTLLGQPRPPTGAGLIVLEVVGERVRVDGGAALGVTPGALLEIEAPGAASARATVESAQAASAWAIVDGGLRIEPGARARVVGLGYESPVCGVAIEEPRLRAALERNPSCFLRLDAPESATFLVDVQEGGYSILDASGETWAHGVAEVGRVAAALRALEHLAAFRAVRALRNRAVSPGLRGTFVVSEPEAVRTSRGSAGATARPLMVVGALPTARPGQRITCTVTNQSSQRLLVTVLALGPDYSVRRLEPPMGRQTALAAGRSLEVTTTMPELPAGAAEASFVIKVCVTSVPVSFDALLMPPLEGKRAVVRGAAVRDAGPLSWLIDAMRRTGTRPVRPLSGDSADNQWLTEDREILIRSV